MSNRVFGIINTQNTCFMNSVLQVLFNVSELRRYIITLDHNHPMIQTFKKVLIYWEKNQENKKVLLKSLCDSVYKHLQFDEGEQQDAHEFFYKFVDCIHEITKKDVILRSNMTTRTGALVACEQAWNKFCQKNYSPIISTFYGQFKNIIECPCSNKSVTREHHCGISVDVSENLLSSIDKYFEAQTIDGYNCDKCNTVQSVVQKRNIEIMPEIMVIQINRFMYNGMKNTRVLPFPITFNIAKYINKEFRVDELTYSLVGIVCHYGNFQNSGHYNVIFKHSDGAWYLADDEHVQVMTQMPLDRIGSTAYMLFYRRL